VLLAELHNPSSPTSLLTALKELKHELIGHQPAKELWVSQGVATPLARILNSYVRSNRYDSDGGLEQDACLQAIIVVGSIAQGTRSLSLSVWKHANEPQVAQHSSFI
jgi:hypothetical protein